MKIVKSIPLLRAMEKKGLIKFHSQTGTEITGLYSSEKFTCCYIDEAIEKVFEFRGKKYEERYFDGCFCPYIVEIEKES